MKVTAAVILFTLVAMVGGCAAPARSTQMTSADLDETTAVMAQKLSASRLLAERTPDSPKMVIAIAKVQNLTSDLIPEGEQWMLMEKVKGSLPLLNLGRERNVAFVIPAEHLSAAKRAGTLPEEAALARNPTHEMTATFLSGTRMAGKDRTDAYLVEYRITSLSTGALEWVETFEFKRAASGIAYD
ncbi:MAG TPA: hypothetical protein VD997_11370 [Phycisphaerales bacterium]|nr:hypothetical protein [Phycisphaerales bacterium]